MLKIEKIETLDITAPKHAVEVQVRKDKKVLWVHVDGITVLRISGIPKLVIELREYTYMEN